MKLRRHKAVEQQSCYELGNVNAKQKMCTNTNGTTRQNREGELENRLELGALRAEPDGKSGIPNSDTKRGNRATRPRKVTTHTEQKQKGTRKLATKPLEVPQKLEKGEYPRHKKQRCRGSAPHQKRRRQCTTDSAGGVPHTQKTAKG